MKPFHFLVVFCVAILALEGCSRGPNSIVLSEPPKHGTQLLIHFDTGIQSDSEARHLKDALEKRCARLDVQIFLAWDTALSNQVYLYTPVTAPESIEKLKAILGRGGRLELRLVHENSEDLVKQGLSEIGYEILKEANAPASASPSSITYLVKKKPELTGAYIESAFTSRDSLGRPEINFALNNEGTKIFEKVTGDNVGRQLAIVVDGELLSAPKIASVIPGGRAIITGNFTQQTADELAKALDSPLPFPITVTGSETF